MKILTFFLAYDLSPRLLGKLNQHKLKREYARTYFLNTIVGQFNHCVFNNMIMVTKSKKLFKLCRQIRHPVIWLKGEADEDTIQEKIYEYVREVRILNNVA